MQERRRRLSPGTAEGLALGVAALVGAPWFYAFFSANEAGAIKAAAESLRGLGPLPLMLMGFAALVLPSLIAGVWFYAWAISSPKRP